MHGIAPEAAAFAAAVERGDAGIALARLLGAGEVIHEGGRLYGAQAVDAARTRLVALLEDFHVREKVRRGIPLGELRERSGAPGPLFERVLAQLVDAGRAAVEHNQVRLAGRAAELDGREAGWRDALVERYARAGLEPPDPEEAVLTAGAPRREGRAILERLVEEGRLTKVATGLYFHAAPLGSARAAVRDFLAERPFASVGELKDLLGVSRKYLIPLLEHFDREGLTRRTPAGRSLARS